MWGSHTRADTPVLGHNAHAYQCVRKGDSRTPTRNDCVLGATTSWHVLSTPRTVGGDGNEEADDDPVAVLDLSIACGRARRHGAGLAVVTSQTQEQCPRLFQSMRGSAKRHRRSLCSLLSSRVSSLLRKSYRPPLLPVPCDEEFHERTRRLASVKQSSSARLPPAFQPRC